jgi:hypothetical protein
LRRKNKSARKKVKRRARNATAFSKQLSSTEPPQNGSHEAVRDILNRLFGDSAETLVKTLADSNQLTPEEAVRMNEIFGEPKKSKRQKRKR